MPSSGNICACCQRAGVARLQSFFLFPYQMLPMTRSQIRIGMLAAALLLMSANAARAQNALRFDFSRPQWTSVESFGELFSVRELPTGAVIATDTRETTVYLIDQSGKRTTAIGQKGDGPAEYRYPFRLLPLPGDTTMLIDRDTRKFLLIDGRGKIVETHAFPPLIGEGVEFIRAADASGQLYFRGAAVVDERSKVKSASIIRWKRGSSRLDTITSVVLQSSPKVAIPKKLLPKGAKDFVGEANVRFAPVDDWAVAASGRIAMIHATPYRVDWVETNKSVKRGAALSYKPVPVTEQDKKRYEPKGPPYVRRYADVKSPFLADYTVMDAEEHVWLPRNEPAGSATRRWDVFDRNGRYVVSVPLTRDRTVIAVTARSAFVVRVDDDGLYWLERYARN